MTNSKIFYDKPAGEFLNDLAVKEIDEKTQLDIDIKAQIKKVNALQNSVCDFVETAHQIIDDLREEKTILDAMVFQKYSTESENDG